MLIDEIIDVSNSPDGTFIVNGDILNIVTKEDTDGIEIVSSSVSDILMAYLMDNYKFVIARDQAQRLVEITLDMDMQSLIAKHIV